MGCTEPSAKPSSTEHKPIARADGKSRIHPEQHGRDHHGARHHGMFTHMLGHQRQQQPHHGRHGKMHPGSEPMTEADSPRSCPMSGTTKVCTSQQDESTQFTMMRRRNLAR